MSGRHYLHNHPSGSWFIRIDAWVLDILGRKEHAAAACFSILEYWQRSLPDGSDGWVIKGPGDFSAKLSHLFGKDKVREGLNLLVKTGWVEEDEETHLVGQLWQRRKKFKLNIDKINLAVDEYPKNNGKTKECDFSASGGAKNRRPDVDKSASRGRKIGVNKYIDAASNKAAVEGPAAASFFIIENEQDRLLLEALNERYGMEKVENEGKLLIQAGKQPYLSSACKALEQKAAAARRQAADAHKATALATPAPVDVVAQANGEALLAKVRQKRASTSSMKHG